MNPEDLYNQLLALGMTEQQIADLVAQEYIKQRARERADGRPVEGSVDPSALASDLLSSLLSSRAGKSETEEDSASAEKPLDDADEGSRTAAVAKLVATTLSGATPPEGTGVIDRAAVPPSQLRAVLAQFEAFSGPMPPPFLARQYEELVPGFTERTLVILEKDAETNREIARESSRRLSRGQHYALIFALWVVAAGVGFAAFGAASAGASLAIATVAAVVGAFLYSRRARATKEDKEATKPTSDSDSA